MPQTRREEFFEVDLSDRKDEPRKKDLDNLIEVDFSKEKLPFEEKIKVCENGLTQVMDEHKVFSFMERRDLLSEDVEVQNSDFVKAKKSFEKRYVDLVCSCTSHEYKWWKYHTLEMLVGSMHPEITIEDSIDPDHVAFRLDLFKKAMETREHIREEAEKEAKGEI